MSRGRQGAGGALASSLLGLVNEILRGYLPLLVETALAHRSAGAESWLAAERALDRELHELYRSRLAGLLPEFVFASEEGAPEIVGSRKSAWPELLLIVDPLDTTELAVRGLAGYTHVCAYSLRERRPIASVVGDFFNAISSFHAFAEDSGGQRAFVNTRDGRSFPIVASGETRLSHALVTTYSMRPVTRFERIAAEHDLLAAIEGPGPEAEGRIGLDFGSVGLCHVAAGLADAMVEVAKGFRCWDLLPGQHILTAAGGEVRSLDGDPLSEDLGIRGFADVEPAMTVRRKFVAAGHSALSNAILAALRSGTTEGAPR